MARQPMVWLVSNDDDTGLQVIADSTENDEIV